MVGSAQAESNKQLCLNFGKSAMMVSIFKLQGDTLEKQLDALAKLKIQHTPAGKALEMIIRMIYDPEAKVDTKADISRIGIDVFQSCMRNVPQ